MAGTTRTITTAIKLDGEAEFKKQMSSVNSELKTLSSELKLSESEFKGQANTVEALTAKDKLLKDQIEQQKVKVDALTQAVKDSAEAYGDTDKRTDSYRQQLNNAKIALNNLNNDLSSNSKHLDEAKSSSDKCASSIDEYGKEVKGAGEKSLTAGDLIKANLTSQAIIGGLKALASAAGEVAGKLKDTVLASAEAGDAVDKGSQKLQVSSKQYQELSFAAERSGTSIDTLAVANKTLQSTDFTGNLYDAIKAVTGISNADERAAKATELFGRKAGQEMLPLLNSGSQGLQEMYDQVNKLGGVMSDEAVKAGAKFEDSLTNLQTAFSGLKNNLSGDFLPSITIIMDGMSQVMSGDVDAGIAAIEQGITDFGNQLEQMGPYAKDALDLVVQVITDNLPSVVECAGQVITSLIDGLCQTMPELIPTVVDVILTIVDTLTDSKNLDALTDGAVAIITQLAVGLIAALPGLIERIPEIIEGIVDAFSDPQNQKKLKEAGHEIVHALWDGVSELGDWLGKKFMNLGDKVAYWIKYGYWEGSGDGSFISGGGRFVDGSHASGLDYVPFDGYIAKLHKGERILTAQEASVLNGLSSANLKTSYASLSASDMQKIAATSVNAINMSGASSGSGDLVIEIPMNGEKFYRATIKDFRKVNKANPEVVSEF